MISYPFRTLATGAVAASISAVMCLAPAAHADATAATPRLHAQTLAHLNTSMRGEAFADASYTLFAVQARHEGLPATARLFRRTAAVELDEHFTEEAGLTGLVGSNAANLLAAATGEGYEATVMYPRFAREARADGDANAAALFSEIAKDEAAHRAAFLTALRVLRTGKGTIPAPPDVTPEPVRAGLPQVHSARTMADLDTAMHGEALAHAKYLLFARHAADVGALRIARLFAGAAAVELREHFTGEANLYGLVRGTCANLGRAVAGERYEARVMYPEFAWQAQAVGDTAAAAVFRHNADDEADHARAFQAARSCLR